MACERYREALADVAAGLPAPAGLEAHLASCEACREELHALRQALAMADAEMAGLLTAEPSPELAVRIRQAVAETEPSPRLALRLAVAGYGRGGHAAGGSRGGAGARHSVGTGVTRGRGRAPAAIGRQHSRGGSRGPARR